MEGLETRRFGIQSHGHGAATTQQIHPRDDGNDFYLKVLCPENKKDYKTVTLRGLSQENTDSPATLKENISVQCRS